MPSRPFAFLIIFWIAYIGVVITPAVAQEPTDAAGITDIFVCTKEWNGATNIDMTGYYWDTVLAVFEPSGVNVKVTFMPYMVSVARAQEQVCDMALGGYKNEFSGLLYPQWPLELEPVIALHRLGTIDDDDRGFIGKKVAWLKDYGFQAHLPADTDFTEVRSESTGLRMLERGRIDFFLDYEEDITEAAGELGIDLSAYVFSPVTVLSRLVYPMFAQNDRGRSLVDLYDRRMAELHQDGTAGTNF